MVTAEPDGFRPGALLLLLWLGGMFQFWVVGLADGTNSAWSIPVRLVAGAGGLLGLVILSGFASRALGLGDLFGGLRALARLQEAAETRPEATHAERCEGAGKGVAERLEVPNLCADEHGRDEPIRQEGKRHSDDKQECCLGAVPPPASGSAPFHHACVPPLSRAELAMLSGIREGAPAEVVVQAKPGATVRR